MYSWQPDRKASRAQIREAIRYAQWEKTEIGGKDDAWYNAACKISQQWRDQVRRQSIRTLARHHLDYWRLRAFLGHGERACPGDQPMTDQWNKFQPRAVAFPTIKITLRPKPYSAKLIPLER